MVRHPQGILDSSADHHKRLCGVWRESVIVPRATCQESFFGETGYKTGSADLWLVARAGELTSSGRSLHAIDLTFFRGVCGVADRHSLFLLTRFLLLSELVQRRLWLVIRHCFHFISRTATTPPPRPPSRATRTQLGHVLDRRAQRPASNDRVSSLVSQLPFGPATCFTSGCCLALLLRLISDTNFCTAAERQQPQTWRQGM